MKITIYFYFYCALRPTRRPGRFCDDRSEDQLDLSRKEGFHRQQRISNRVDWPWHRCSAYRLRAARVALFFSFSPTDALVFVPSYSSSVCWGKELPPFILWPGASSWYRIHPQRWSRYHRLFCTFCCSFSSTQVSLHLHQGCTVLTFFSDLPHPYLIHWCTLPSLSFRARPQTSYSSFSFWEKLQVTARGPPKIGWPCCALGLDWWNS